MFITFEGPEGAGKTTQVRLLAEALRESGRKALVTFEPGGTPLGDALRSLLLTPDPARPVTPSAEVLLFAAARAQLVDEVIKPALERGEIVVCDRFADSTWAYQVSGRGLPADAVAWLGSFATAGIRPDLTFLLDLDVSTGLARKRGGPVDRLEREEQAFHERVRAGYLALAEREDGRFVVLDATRAARDIAAVIRARVLGQLERD